VLGIEPLDLKGSGCAQRQCHGEKERCSHVPKLHDSGFSRKV
jgi:hypothetical protein